MTYILGFKCFDGLVLCSESLEEDGYNKKIVHKLGSVTIADDWGIAIGCAGTGPGINKFMDKLKDLLGDGLYDRFATETVIEATLKYMQQQYPKEAVEIVAGIWGPNETNLYRTYQDSNCLSVEPKLGYVCTGMDLSLPNVFLDSVFDELMGVDDAAKLGIFVTALMKDRVEGCGGPTRVKVYKKGTNRWRDLESEEVEEIERQFPMEEVHGMIYEYWRSKR